MERTILEALGYYLIRLVMFGATAAAGIAVGIKLRKNKIKVNPYDWQKT